MIQANELRIGNWLMMAHENVPEMVNIKVMQFIAHANSIGDKHPFEPIPLSPDVLKACGFQRLINSNDFWEHFVLGNGWYISKSNHDEDSAGVIKDRFYWSDNYIEIKYLHQIQNLFYSLTGTELSYTP